MLYFIINFIGIGGGEYMNREYEIMHRDQVVAFIDIKTGYIRIEKQVFMPHSLYFEDALDLEAAVNNINNFYHWCATRLLSLDRKYAKEILNSIGAKQAVTDKDRAEIALTYRCLSLRDVYWVREKGDNSSYKNINLYNHSLNDAMVDIALRGRNLTVNNSSLIASDLSTNGLFPKAWMREENGFVLLKDGGADIVHKEYLASEITKCFTNNSVDYKLRSYKGELVTESKIFTDLNHSILPMEDFDIYCANQEIDLYEYIKTLDANNYYVMNLIDYLIGNTDRHMGNWGLLIDNNSNQPIKLHPLMDFNHAFEGYDDLEGGRSLTVKGVMSQRQAAIEAAEMLGGLLLVKELPYHLFEAYGYVKEKEMFMKRMEILDNYLYY